MCRVPSPRRYVSGAIEDPPLYVGTESTRNPAVRNEKNARSPQNRMRPLSASKQNHSCVIPGTASCIVDRKIPPAVGVVVVAPPIVPSCRSP